MSDFPDKALLINYNWHHAVNDQSKLNKVLAFLQDDDGDDGNIDNMKGLIEAIEADIIYSDAKSQAVMGHPPSVDGNLTLTSFLHQLQHGFNIIMTLPTNMNAQCSSWTSNPLMLYNAV